MHKTHRLLGATAGVLAVLAVAACGSGADASTDDAEGATVTIEDNFGTQTVPSPPTSVVATDNGTFETLDTWGVELSAGAVSLMPDTISYKTNDAIVDLGNHREPDLEAVVAAEPDLVINGGRYGQYRADFEKLVPEAAIVEVNPRDEEAFDAELKRGATALGEIFGKQDEAAQLNEEFDASIERVKTAYSTDDKVMGLIVSGGEIGYVAPSAGRTIGPMFDIIGFTPALEVPDSSDDHQGDDISVEAIADSNPDLIIVMDRDAPLASAEGSTPAAEVIEKSEALQNVPAVKDQKVVYMPEDTYLNESIQTYTEFFNTLADALEAQ